ncbi:MAG: DNA polymerase III subunit delta [Magnetococcales bacterium]|nr:DNA polymerase III subunit delta [Magnetococcales bacterium]
MRLKNLGELQGRLRSGEKLPAAVLLHGPDQGRIQKLADRLKTLALEGADADFDVETFFGAELDQERFFSACRSMPFMAPRRVVTVKNADRIHPAIRKTIGDYLQDPSPDALLIFTGENLEASNPLRKGMEKAKSGWSVPFYAMEGRDLARWLRETLQEGGYQTDPDVIPLLLPRLEGNSMAAEQELEKLKLYMGKGRHITLEDALAVVGETTEYSGFLLARAMLDGETGKALAILDRLLQGGLEAPMLLGAVTMKIRQIIRGKELLEEGMNPKAVARKLRVFWKEEQSFMRHCNRFSVTWLARALLEAMQTDLRLRESRIPTEQVLGRFVMRLSKGG